MMLNNRFNKKLADCFGLNSGVSRHIGGSPANGLQLRQLLWQD